MTNTQAKLVESYIWAFDLATKGEEEAKEEKLFERIQKTFPAKTVGEIVKLAELHSKVSEAPAGASAKKASRKFQEAFDTFLETH